MDELVELLLFKLLTRFAFPVNIGSSNLNFPEVHSREHLLKSRELGSTETVLRLIAFCVPSA